MKRRHVHLTIAPAAATLGLLLLMLAGCATSRTIEQPIPTLRTVESGPRQHLAAMEILDAGPADEAYIEALQQALWKPGYTVEVREAAFHRLAELDEPALKLTLRRYLPRMTAWEGLERLSELIAENGYEDLTPALVSSWARPVAFHDDRDRPEYRALVALHGEGEVVDAVFDLMLTSTKVSEQGLRTRCWTLLDRLGERDRLSTLLERAEIDESDAFLLDLRAAAVELGVIPHNREEILWIRKLRQPEHAAFWSAARKAVPMLPEARRDDVEVRDIAVIVSAARHHPELLAESNAELYRSLGNRLDGQKHYSHGSNYGGVSSSKKELLHEWRDELTWSDLAAMHLVLDAMAVPQVAEHLFDYAERDRADKTTEYGGVLQLDELGRYEVREFIPRVRHHDQKFLASQAMFDAGYNALFHFHFHVQRANNDEYAGPGFGDINYADNTRANCLVLTSVDRNRMNIDYYRHGRVSVDLGVVERPTRAALEGR